MFQKLYGIYLRNLVEELQPYWDHVFNALSLIRIIMDDWSQLPFMYDFEKFKWEFKKLLQTVGLTSKQNQDVKVKGNGQGEIKMIKQLHRYSNITFVNIKTGEICNIFH